MASLPLLHPRDAIAFVLAEQLLEQALRIPASTSSPKWLFKFRLTSQETSEDSQHPINVSTPRGRFECDTTSNGPIRTRFEFVASGLPMFERPLPRPQLYLL